MGLTNYHIHSSFCDGFGDPEEYIQQAVSCGFTAVGFSSHAPVPFVSHWNLAENRLTEYCERIRFLKAKYMGVIQIYLGLEVDYLPKYKQNFSRLLQLNLDYIIGSVHFVGSEGQLDTTKCIHGSAGDYAQIIDTGFKGDIQLFVHTYYDSVREMVKQFKPQIIAHLDLIKKNNILERYFSEKSEWYRSEVLKTLRIIAESGCILEVNTSGLSKASDFYPSEWVLKEAWRLHIPIILNSDAHTPRAINAFFPQAAQALRLIGYSQQRILLHGAWRSIALGRCVGSLPDDYGSSDGYQFRQL